MWNTTSAADKNQTSGVLAAMFDVWLCGVVVTALDLRLEIAGSIPDAAVSSATFGKSFTDIYGLLPSSVMRYERKLGRGVNRHTVRVRHTGPVFMVLQLRLVPNRA